MSVCFRTPDPFVRNAFFRLILLLILLLLLLPFVLRQWRSRGNRDRRGSQLHRLQACGAAWRIAAAWANKAYYTTPKVGSTMIIAQSPLKTFAAASVCCFHGNLASSVENALCRALHVCARGSACVRVSACVSEPNCCRLAFVCCPALGPVATALAR